MTFIQIINLKQIKKIEFTRIVLKKNFDYIDSIDDLINYNLVNSTTGTFLKINTNNQKNYASTCHKTS